MKTIIFLIGSPLAGKSTQADKLVDFFADNVTSIKLGKEIRKYAKKDDYIRNLIENGLIVPEDLTRKIFVDSAINSKFEFVVVDGYPRTEPQIPAVLEVCRNFDICISIHLKVDRDVVKQRMINRTVCSKCDKSFTNYKDNKCIACGHEIVKRIDDNESSLSNRAKQYDNTITIISSLLESNNIYCHDINGNENEDLVFNNIIQIINNEVK